MRRCTGNTSPRTLTSSTGKTRTSNSRRWALRSAPPRWKKATPLALQHYFPERDFVPLMEVLATVNRHTGWMEEFQHWQQRHHHGRPEDRVVYAGLIGI